MRLRHLIPQGDDRAVPGIRIWLRRWFTSMAILFTATFALMLVPIRDPYGNGWASIVQFPRLNSDVQMILVGYPLKWYMVFFPPLLLWHLLDLCYVTGRPVTAPRWERLGYRVMTLGLIVATFSNAVFNSKLLEYSMDDPNNYGFDGGAFYQPAWLDGLWYAALLAVGGGIVDRAVRAIAMSIGRRRKPSPASG